MCFAKKAVMMFVLALAVTGGLWAQRPGGMGGMFGSMPSMPSLQNPTVGSGSEYLITAKGKEMDVAMVALGKEDVDGATGFWMEQRITSAEMGGEMVMKTLTVTTGTDVGIKRMIMQRPGQAPMEMPAMMMGMMQQHQHPSTSSQPGGKDSRGELVGTESVTVPAGTFSCQHYRKQENNGPVDLWISTQVTPYAMVKMSGPDMTMVLKKILSNETSHITGEPQKMQFPQMPH
ncbi:MAG: hypothetical protein WAO35_02575 [Terriglobia bacterium]